MGDKRRRLGVSIGRVGGRMIFGGRKGARMGVGRRKDLGKVDIGINERGKLRGGRGRQRERRSEGGVGSQRWERHELLPQT